MVAVFIIGSGPSELHAQIALDRRLQQLGPHSGAHTLVVATSVHDGDWSVLATVQHGETGKESR